MTLDNGLQQRLIFLIRIIKKEQAHLNYSASKLFKHGFEIEQALALEQDPELAETLEAFVGRFCRLQDTVGDKLLPAWLKAVQEKSATFVDNLDKAEKLNLLASSDQWLVLRQNRNKMIHEYIEDLTQLVDAVQLSFEGIGLINSFADNLIADMMQRFQLKED